MVLTNYPLSSFAVCADPNAGARQQAKIAHQQKLFKYKSDSVKYWNKETAYARKASFIQGIGESRARSDIAQLIERKRGQTLSTKEKLAQKYATEQHVNEGGGSRNAGRNQYLKMLNQQADAEKSLSQLSGRGQSILLEKQKRIRSGMLAKAKDDVGMVPQFGAPVMMPGKDTGAMFMGALSTGLSIASMFAGSDIRMKEDIEQVGVSPDGHKIYEFNYIGKPTRYRGAMAQEVAKIDPMAVGIRQDGYLGVNYGKIDVNMEVIS